MEQRIDALYALPLSEFTAARNVLARELATAGDANADDVRALAKPPATVWAINQAARGEKLAVRRLLKAADALRQAQQAVLNGKRASLSDAQQRERDAVRVLAEAAARALASDGRPAGRAQIERIERTLGAAAVDPAARDLLAAGRLAQEIHPVGFDALAGIELPPRRPSPKARDEGAARRRKLEQAARDAEQRAVAAEREADHARRVAEEARRAAEEAAAALDRL